MEIKNNSEQYGSSHSWWLDHAHHRPLQSQWLHSTLSDLDKKIKKMLTLIEDDGDTFAQRAEMFYKKRPELIKSVEDLHRSYRALADKYDQLKFESIRASTLGSSSNSLAQFQKLHREARNSHHDPGSDSDNSNLDFEDLNLKNIESEIKEENGAELDDDHYQMGGSDRQKMWSEMRSSVSKVIEDTLHLQAELIRRNEEKREAIKELCARINKLMNENRDLKSSMAQTKVNVKRNRSQLSRVKEVILKKLLPKF